ncbi:MAG: hypothetical protein Q9227_000603 [Pyrenula ochraceoflavens]
MSTDVVRHVHNATTGTIAAKVRGCLEAFRALCLALSDESRNFEGQLQLEDVQDEQGRFRLWSGNIGAHRIGRASLDYRLRDASHIQQRTISLLDDLNETIEDARAIVQGEKVPWDSLEPEPDSDSGDETENVDIADEASDKATKNTLENKTELGQLRSSMGETVTLLLRLSMAIHSPAPHDQFMKSINIDTSHFEKYDIIHVRQKFPQAKEYLVDRLGKAISRRRQYLKYREEHHRKLAHGVEITENSFQDTSCTEVIPQTTVASSLQTALKNMNRLDFIEDSGSETGFSGISTETSASDLSMLRAPPLPKEAQDNSPFECPLCFTIISVRNTRSWR